MKAFNDIKVEVGIKIKFAEDNLWYTVQAFNTKFIICNAVTKKNTYHTIIDISNNIRGADNLVLHSGYDNMQECQDRLEEITKGVIELSSRNRIKLNITKVESGKRKSFGLTSEKAERISKNTEKAYLEQYPDLDDNVAVISKDEVRADQSRLMNEIGNFLGK